MLDHGNSAGGSIGRAALAALIALALVPAPAAAQGACGSTSQEAPRKDVSLGRAPIAIGDSPMLLALPDLAKVGYRANARGCRQYPEGLALMRDLKRRDKLPRLVVIALGSNGSVRKSDIHKALRIVGKKRTLGLVTPLETGGGSSSDAEVIRREAERHAKRIELLDWVAFSSGHPGWFQPDGLHLTFDGAAAMARLLKKPLKDLPPPHRPAT